MVSSGNEGSGLGRAEPGGSEEQRIVAPSEAWLAWRDRIDLVEYDRRFERLADDGQNAHGEADAVDRLGGSSVFDAGCGTGRVGAELARRGWSVVGADNDPDMVARARIRPVQARWIVADLATVDAGGPFDVVLMAGNILLFCERGSEALIVANLARHLAAGGALIAGWSLDGGPSVEQYDDWCSAAGLSVAQLYATWDSQPFDGGGYAVAVHRAPGTQEAVGTQAALGKREAV